ncbi:MAG: tRNA (adenosine(37)-N6)-threonylcarbamoyltransferase complex transferase subunit TsaD [Synergistaceae bacterium]|nr:tRNA (adenosine(37)-N6)-threonylcarbamoyltransferase complex transferase subunit TsaD [Synergistaceae bacterium]
MMSAAKELITLGIETSCDDTALALLKGRNDILSSVISSQIESHSEYGGVVPELASRMHQEMIIPLLEDVIDSSGINDPAEDIDLIAVTAGPGLIGSLLVGVMTAKALSQAWKTPIIGVNHLEGHIFANIAVNRELSPPFISAVVSGGHTEIILVKDLGEYELLGSTRDDAAGEAYDKIAKMMGLGYPGGPVIDRLASRGDPKSYLLPTPLSSTGKVEFSFSGLKTAAANIIRNSAKTGISLKKEDICASFQKAVIESLLCKIKLAMEMTGIKRLTLSGGVASNSGLRRELREMAEEENWELFLPSPDMCTDNAVMIASAGIDSFLRGNRSDLLLSPDPSWEIW